VTTTRPDRLVALEGCFNFRDLGGYPTSDGRIVRWRRLFRADGPHALTNADARMLGELGLQSIIDLRTTDETERGQYVTHAGTATSYHLPMTDVLPDERELANWTDPVHVGEHYIEMATRGRDAIAQAIRIMAADDALPAVFHCSAGKDRTGVLAALLLGMLGVPDDTIIADYALSRDAMTRMLVWIESRTPDREQFARVAPAVRAAEPQAMAAFLAGTRQRHGSFDGVAAELGVGAEVARLRDLLLEVPQPPRAP